MDQELYGLGKATLFLRGSLGVGACLCSVVVQLLLRQLLDSQAADGVDHQTNDGKDQGSGAPACGPAAELLHQTGDAEAHDDVGDNREHEAEGAQLHTLVVVLGDQRSQGRISDIIGGIEHSVQCGVYDEEVDILHGGAASRDGKQQKQAERNAYLAIQHPGTSLAQLGVGAVNKGAKDHIADAVQDLGGQH